MSLSRLDRLLSISISRLYLLLLSLLPLLFSMKSSEVFEFPKMLFVYATTILIVTCWIARMIVNRKVIHARTPLDIPLYLYLLSQILATVFSIDVHTSLFGYYSRWNGGLLSTIAYTLLYAGYVSNSRLQSTDDGLQKKSQFPRIGLAVVGSPLAVSAIVASATIVSLYALLQRLGIDRDLWVQDVMARVFSTQGQPNWLAAYLVMVMPLAWWLGTKAKGQRPSDKGRIYGTLLQPLALRLWPLFLLALFFTRSRSGLVGFVVADLTFWSVMLCNYLSYQRSLRQQPTFSISKKQYRLKTIVYHPYSLRLTQRSQLVFSFLAIHTLILVLVLLTNNPAREWMLRRVQSSRLAGGRAEFRIQNFSSPGTRNQAPGTDSITPSSDIRKIVWGGAIDLVKQRPLFGWGPETFAYTYWKVRPVAHNMTSEWNFLYNKAHNEWLNLAANTGLVGLGTHLLLLGWLAVWSIFKISRITNHESRITIAAILAAILGVESVNLFGFSTVTTQAYSYIFMGMAMKKDRDERIEIEKKNKFQKVSMHQWAELVGISLIALYLVSQISISFLADLSYNRGKQYAKDGYLADAQAALDAAVDLVPNEPVFRSELAEAQGVLALTTLTSLKDTSLTNFAIVETQGPANVSFLRTRARVTYALGSLDPSLYNQGIALLRHTMELAPTDPKIPYNLGVMLEDRGQMDDAKKMFEKSIELKPDYKEAQTILESLSE